MLDHSHQATLKESVEMTPEFSESFYQNSSLKAVVRSEEIPTPEDIEIELPLLESHKAFIQKSRRTLENILNGVDKRLFLIVGPCSIHDMQSAREYAKRFQKLAEETAEHFFLIMRAYVEKPRTILGWKGILSDPDLDGTYDLAKGIRLTRRLFLELSEMKIPIASEILEINTSSYYSDFLTWGCVGARTSNSPPHRQLASSLSFPIGFKNTTDGNIDNSIRSVLAASSPHVFLGVSKKGKLSRIHGNGNQNCHLVLRGGETGPNYDPIHISAAQEKCRRAGITDKLVIDCSHDNCGKIHTKQIHVFQSVMHQLHEGCSNIAGLMLESHLYSGSQPFTRTLRYGVSITDPCLDWETTEFLIKEACSRLKASSLCLI